MHEPTVQKHRALLAKRLTWKCGIGRCHQENGNDDASGMLNIGRKKGLSERGRAVLPGDIEDNSFAFRIRVRLRSGTPLRYIASRTKGTRPAIICLKPAR
jgi:hypothetical protein